MSIRKTDPHAADAPVDLVSDEANPTSWMLYPVRSRGVSAGFASAKLLWVHRVVPQEMVKVLSFGLLSIVAETSYRVDGSIRVEQMHRIG